MLPLINERCALEKHDDRLRDAERDFLRSVARDAAKPPRKGRGNWLRAAVQILPRRATDPSREA